MESGHDCRHHCKRTPLWGCVGEKDLHTKLPYAQGKKNNNDRTQYRQRDHHEAIVSRDVFNAANHLRASRTYKKKNHPLPVLSVVDDGILRGYVPFDKDWTGFSAEEYREAFESVMREKQSNTVEVRNRLDLTGYEIVRAQYFATLQNPAMTISNGRLRFNAACLKKFDDVEYVELLLNSVDRCIAIRPCEKSNLFLTIWKIVLILTHGSLRFHCDIRRYIRICGPMSRFSTS